jgi:hypothetical protein
MELQCGIELTINRHSRGQNFDRQREHKRPCKHSFNHVLGGSSNADRLRSATKRCHGLAPAFDPVRTVDDISISEMQATCATGSPAELCNDFIACTAPPSAHQTF